MRIGIGIGISGGQPTLAELVGEAQRAERSGFASVWMPNLTRGFDALSVLLLAGRETYCRQQG